MRTTRRPTIRLVSAGLLGLAVAAALALVAWGPARPSDAATAVTVVNNDFEDGTTQSWTPRGTAEAVANSTAAAHGGTHSLLVTGRTSAWQGPQLDVLNTMQSGVQYTISVWVRLTTGDSSTQPFRMSVERRYQGTASYDMVVNTVNATSGSWVQLTGTYTLANTVDYLTVYVETVSGTANFHIDDFTMSYVPAIPIQTDLANLKDVLASSFLIGAAVSPAELLNEHGQLLSKHFNSLTPGNSLKWDATEKTEGTFTYTDADTIINYAKAHSIKVRGHTLVWHNQTPAWVFLDANGAAMTATAENKTLLLTRLENHIKAVAGRYANDIYAWDVVNEIIDENQSDGLRRSTWYNIAGLDYIRTAFRAARAAAPNAKLYINDYNTTVAAKRDKLFTLVQQLKAEGVPIDGVGHQMHGNVDWPSAADTQAAIEKFAPLGVEQQVTEMDVSVYTNNTDSFTTISQDLLIRQANRYKALFDVFISHKSSVNSVTVWGLADDNSWLNSYPITRMDAPLFFDRQLQAKPAYWAIVDPTKISASATVTTTPTRTSASPTSASPSRTSASPSRTSASPTSVSPSRTTASPTRTSASPTSASPTRTTASPTSTGGACRVTYTIMGQWPGGFQGQVTLTNGGTTTINGWTVVYSFANGQQISQLWNGSYTQSGSTVTVTNASWNGTLAAGGSTNFGFLASWTGTNAAPTAFTLNGTSCTVG